MKKASVIFSLLSFILTDTFSQNVRIGMFNPTFRLDVASGGTQVARFSGDQGMYISLQPPPENSKKPGQCKGR